MALTPEQIEDRLKALEDKNEELGNLLGSGRGDSRIPLLATSFDVEDAIFSNHSIYVIKSANETATSDITLSDDSELTFPVEPDEDWLFEFFLICDGVAAADIKFTLNVPGSTVGEWAVSTVVSSGTFIPTYAAHNAFGGAIGIGLPGTQKVGVHIFGALTPPVSGNVTLQWAQNTSNGSPTTVHKYSWLRATRII